MLYITDYTAAKDFHNALVRCWFLIKINGKHSNNNRTGHNCGTTTCPICTIGTQKHTFPVAFTDFIKKKNNLDILISGSPNELRLLSLRYKKISLTANERRGVKDFFFRISL